jgi:hypothetical protein
MSNQHRRRSDQSLVNVQPNIRVDELLAKYPTQLDSTGNARDRMIEVLTMWDSWLKGKIEKLDNFELANLIKCVAHHEK